MAAGFTVADFHAKQSILDPRQAKIQVLGRAWLSGHGRSRLRLQACQFKNFEFFFFLDQWNVEISKGGLAGNAQIQVFQWDASFEEP